MFLGEAVLTGKFGLDLARGVGDAHADLEPPVGGVVKLHLDGRAGGKVRREFADRAAADVGAIVGGRVFALDDLDEDRPLLRFMGPEGPLGGHRDRRVAGDEDPVAVALRERVDADHAEAVGVDVADAGTRRLAAGLVQQEAGAEGGPVGDRLVGGDRGVGLLGGDLADHGPDHGHAR